MACSHREIFVFLLHYENLAYYATFQKESISISRCGPNASF